MAPGHRATEVPWTPVTLVTPGPAHLGVFPVGMTVTRLCIYTLFPIHQNGEQKRKQSWHELFSESLKPPFTGFREDMSLGEESSE